MNNGFGFDDIGSDDGHDDFANYLAGRGYDPKEMGKTQLKWDSEDDNYEKSTDKGVKKLNELRKDFIEEGKTERWDATYMAKYSIRKR